LGEFVVLAADESCWLLGELVLQYDSSAAADKRCWLLGELVVQNEPRRDTSYDRIGWLLTRAAGCWGEQIVRGVF
jgi:hypothetical protein